jgi:RNA polymerase sigma factor (sigma-70 family)
MAKLATSPILQLIRGVVEDPRVRALSDRDLLQRFHSQHDEAAFHTLLHRHGPMVLDVCRGLLGNGPDAEDSFQATFLILAQKAGTIRKGASLGSWLHGVARYTALKTRIRSAARQKHEAKAPVRQVAQADDLNWREVRQLLHEELERIPERYREPLVLCYLESATQQRAAARLGLAERTLRERLERGRELLRLRLVRRGLSPAVILAVAAGATATASAAVPAVLEVSTIKAATSVAAGGALASVVSARVVAIAEGVQQTMRLTKLKGFAAVLLACVALGGLTVSAAHYGLAEERANGPPAAKEEPPPAAAPALVQAPGGKVVSGESGRVEAVAFSPDNQLLAAGSADRKVHLWKLRSGKVLRTLEGPQGIVRRVVFSNDGKTVAAGADDGSIFLWDVATGKVEAELLESLPRKPKDKDPLDGAVGINGLLFLPGGLLAVVYNYQHRDQATWYSCVVLWDVRKKKAEALYEERGHSYGLALSPDGKLLAAAFQGDSNGFKVWDLDSRKPIWEEQAGPDFMTTVVFAPDGKTLAVGGGHSVEVQGGFRAEGRLWAFDVKTRKQLWHVKEPNNWTYSRIAFTADGKGVLTGSSGPLRAFRAKGVAGSKVLSELRRWDAATGNLVWKTEGELGNFQAIDVSADGKTVAGSDDAQLMLFDPETGALRTVLAKVRP